MLLRSHFRRYWPAAAVLIAGLAISGGLGWELHREAREIDGKRLAIRIEEVVAQLDGRIEKTEQLLGHAQDYLMFSGESRERVFNEWCSRRGLLFNFTWLHGVMVATNRLASDWRSALPDPPSSWSRRNWMKFEEMAMKQPIECHPALKSATRNGARFLDDYDLRASPDVTNTFSTAIRTLHLRISGRRTVMLDSQGNALTGALFYVPVFRTEIAEFISQIHWQRAFRSSSARWMHLDSVIVAPLDFKALEQSVWDGKDSDLGLELFSSTNQTVETWLNATRGMPRAADPGFSASMTARVPWAMYGKRFSIFFYTTPLFEAQSPRRLARTATAGGAGVTLLASALVGIILHSRQRSEQMTAEIMDARDALAATEKEREKLGHDLHDGAIQSLYAIQLGLSRTAESVAASLPASAQILAGTRHQVDEVIAELRRFILAREQSDESREVPDLEQVLASLVQRLQTTTPASLSFAAAPTSFRDVPVAHAVTLTQVARTALANCLRHAQAKQIKVALQRNHDAIQLTIEDDGAGFDTKQRGGGGVGLHTMRRRITEAGGRLVIESKKGHGTRICASLPCPPAASAEAGASNA